MTFYLDTEFHEDGRTIDLISIALVTTDGREFYAVSRNAELHRVKDWVRENVLPHLPPYGDSAWMTRAEIREAVREFTATPGKAEVWAYYADYDWVVLSQLFGTMIQLPDHLPMFCRDLKQLAVDLGDPELPKQVAGEHNALADARWNREVHEFLKSMPRPA